MKDSTGAPREPRKRRGCLLVLALVVLLTARGTRQQLGKYPEYPQIYGGVRVGYKPSGGGGHMDFFGPAIGKVLGTLDLLPSFILDTALLPLTVWAPLIRQRDPLWKAIGPIKMMGGKVKVDKNKAVVSVHLSGTKVTDAGLAHLKGLTKLKVLSLAHSKVTDAGLVHLKGLMNLETLHLIGTTVTDAGLVHLKELPNLGELQIRDTKVIGVGLVHLKGLTNLRRLSLNKVTDAGLVHLEGMTNLQELSLHGSWHKVTDAGLAHLKGMTNLERLQLTNTNVTDAGLLNLKGLTNLAHLSLTNTKVTGRGVDQLQQALPKCKIWCVQCD